MELYLVQHAEAKPEEEDPARPLTERGRKEAARVAHAAADLGLDVAVICHSGKLRAQQTAEILAERLEPRKGLSSMAGLGPKDDPEPIRRAVEQAAEPWMMVGHLPQLGRLSSLLLVGDPEREIVAFRMGAIVCLSQGPGGWRLCFVLTPEIAGRSRDLR